MKLPISRSRQGLTLIELIVVLVILVALAGILIPTLPSVLGRAHTSTGATNAGELTKNIQLYEATAFRYPDRMDSLMENATDLYTRLPGGAATSGGSVAGTVGGQLVVVPSMSAAQADALTNAGIQNVWIHSAAAPQPTFAPYANVPPIAADNRVIAATAPMVTLTAAAANSVGLNGTETYAVFGIGRYCSLVGSTITDPPVHFADSTNDTPDTSYGRLVAVFQLTREGGTVTLDKAKLVGTLSLHRDGVVNTDGHLEEYYGLPK